VINEIDYIKKHLKKWMKPKKVASVAALSPSFSEIRFVPLCEPAVLIIVPFNYPLFLSGIPAVGALAAGSPCVLKLNPDNEAMTRLYEKLIPEYFDESCLRFVSGGVENTTELLKHPWGLCLFTGSGRVGKIVQEATAKTLTPTILELGGKSPCMYIESCIQYSISTFA
jgi:aldehyde dehydrogenase (NAD+)